MSVTGSPGGDVSEAGTGANEARKVLRRMRSGLLPRIVISVGALAIGLAIVFAVLIVAVKELRHHSLQARRSQQVIATANGLETLVIDLETGLRGFVITNRTSSLAPWYSARQNYPKEMRMLLALTGNEPTQHAAALQIKAAIDRYLTTYSVPLVRFMLRNPDAPRQVVIKSALTSRVDEIRGLFLTFLTTEERLGAAQDAQASHTSHRAYLTGVIGLVVALLFLLAVAVYLEWAIARPIRFVAEAARRVAGGDLSGRLPTEGPGEIGVLERSFNTMADSLQRGRDDLEERNRRLVESERLKTELVSNVSHELRTPLASVLGFSDLMLKRDVDPDDRRRYLELIRSEAARLGTLLNDLLDLQRHELGALRLVRQPVDLNELLRVQVTLYSAQSELHDLSFEPANEPLVVDGDPDRLAQVIGNLLSNAIKYSPDGGSVEVSASPVADEAWVWVRDRGLGIPREHQDQIFTKFFRADAARTRGIGGTGLGLVLAQQILEAHGGDIGFESEEGHGSTFWIRLPAVTDGSVAAAHDETKARHGT
jgi:signal transduction histidine kinase